MRNILTLCGALALLPSATLAVSVGAQDAVLECLVGNAEALEPDHDNLADLAVEIVANKCFAERNAYLQATGATNSAGLAAYAKLMEDEVRTALIALRSERTGLTFLSSN